MRSFREITFRLRHEAANALLSFSWPNLTLQADAPLALLPDPKSVADVLRNADYTREVIATADEILQGRIPIFDTVIDYGAAILWRRDPHRGTETPATYFRRIPYLDLAAAGDHKFIWEVNRHQHLVLLAQAAVLTGNEVYSEHIFRQLEHWSAENPFQRGINWTSALEVAFRALSWIWIFHLVGARMPVEFRRRFLAELYRHGLHLENNLSIYFSPNTHLLGEAVALHALGRLFPQFPRTERWGALGRDIVHGHIQARVNNDGSYFEQSTYYHVYALDMFAFHAVIENVPASYRERLSRMAEFLAAIVSDGGDLPFLGDDDGGRFFHPYGRRPRFARATLATASLLAGKRFFPFSERDLAEIAMWWLGPERCALRSAEMHSQSSRVFADTGIVVMRRGPVVALFDAGPFGPWGAGHSHSDTLSLVVTIGDCELLIDSGTYSYMDTEARDIFRGTASHNTVRLGDIDQAFTAGPFHWLRKPEVRLLEFTSDADTDRAVAVCSCMGFTHTRTVEFSEGALAIIDHIEGPPGEQQVESSWHFAHDPQVLGPGKWSIADLAEFTAEGGTLRPGWRSRCFGSKETASVIGLYRRTVLPVTLHTRLIISA